MTYDVIVVGTRVAGAATAMLLARSGLRVLAIDRSAFPSDTISSHQVQLPGIARLQRWGLLDRLVRAGTPATARVRFDPGHVVIEGDFPAYEGVSALYSPRRTVLDPMLIDAAREAGAEERPHRESQRPRDPVRGNALALPGHVGGDTLLPTKGAA